MNPLTTDTLGTDAETLLFEHGVMVVDGDTVTYMTSQFGGPTESVPPSWAVAATQPCVTCGGLGCTCVKFCERADDHVCPDCHSGRPVVEVQTACGRPTQSGVVYHDGYCCRSGRLSTFWTVGECLPIVAGMEGRDIDGPHFRAWTALGGSTAHGVAGLPERWGDLPGDPAGLVGKFALTGCEQVTR